MPRKRAALQIDRGADFELLLAGVGENSPLDNDEERRRYWYEHRERLLSRVRASTPGKRPWPWWHYEAARPAYVLPELDWTEDGLEASGNRGDDREAESVAFVASIDELDPDELAEIRWRAEEARGRIDTPAERRCGDEHGPDRRAVKVAEAVERALR